MAEASRTGHDTPFAATFRRGLERLVNKDTAGWVSMFAEDGAMEFPFAPPGYPERLEGRAAIAEYMRGYPDIVDLASFHVEAFHQTVNPDVVIVEFSTSGRAIPTNRPYTMRYVGVITMRGGEIVNYRDYWNPLVAAAALGGAEAMVSAFAQEAR
ncbi:nuclear transport factor 2 family protein [Sorangium sp. So ce131]|uniref:nuclear transport factor 2 family protein n=1 Tax=Sorangium sp. So ce131 TaxID=3133282 RepID=UPI003F636C20